TFVNNATQWRNGGGAIFSLDSEIVIVNSHFENNSSHDTCVAIRFDITLMLAQQSSFVANNGGFGGGAIRADGSLILEDCLFSLNQAIFGGAAVQGGHVDISHSTFSNNSGSGPALWGGGNWKIVGSLIANNGG